MIDPLAHKILEGAYQPGDKIEADDAPDGEHLTFEKRGAHGAAA